MKRRIRAGVFVFLAAGVAMTGGCAAGGGSGEDVGTYVYMRGEVMTVESAPFENVWEAVIASMESLSYEIQDKGNDGSEASVIARQPDDTRVEINLRRVDGASTRMRIRIGVFGDEEAALFVVRAIRAKLRANQT